MKYRMENSVRLNWIDWAKSIGILIVVLCHTPQYPNFGYTFFSSFQMPLFFILAGYLHKNSATIAQALKKYWSTIIVPYFLFQLIFYPYWFIVQIYDGQDVSTLYNAILKPFTQCLIGIPINGVTWFLVALLIMKLYANYIFSKSYSTRLTIISCIVVVAVRYMMYMNNDSVKISSAIDSTLIFFPFFFMGYFMKKHSIFNHIFNRRLKLYLLPILSFFISILLLKFHFPSYEYTLLLFYLKGISGSLSIIGLCLILNNISSNIIYTISTGTILIFGLHWMFIGTFNFLVKQLSGIQGDIQYSFPMALLIAIGIVFINYFIILFCKKHFPIILGYRK